MIMHFVYILYSKKLNRFYIGETFDVLVRIKRHNSDYYDNKFTAKGKPWELFLKVVHYGINFNSFIFAKWNE